MLVVMGLFSTKEVVIFFFFNATKQMAILASLQQLRINNSYPSLLVSNLMERPKTIAWATENQLVLQYF